MSHNEHEQDENDQMPMPVVYKKRARVKFTHDQVEKLISSISLVFLH